MNEHPMMVACLQGQATQPGQMINRQIARVVHAVALERCFAAVGPPCHEIAIRPISIGGADQHLLVVAAQADEVTISLPSTLDQQLHNSFAERPAIDVIAEKNETGAPAAAKGVARRQKRFQFFEAAVDVPDRKCDRVIRDCRQFTVLQWHLESKTFCRSFESEATCAESVAFKRLC
jgi:hypothetical protein